MPWSNIMHWSTDLIAAGIQCGLALALAAPFVLVAALHSRTRRWALLAAVGSLVVLSFVLTSLPRVDGFRNHPWAWQESLLSIAWPILLTVVAPGISLATLGVTSRLRPGSIKPGLIALSLALSISVVFFVLGARKTLDTEGWIYLSLMPGLAEELVFRGVFQSLLNQVFGKPWSFAKAEFGWSLPITTLLFAAVNGLLSVDSQLHPHVSLVRGIAPMISGLIAGWVRERTDSIWPTVVGHNLVNLVIPLGSLLLKSL
jgi:membrane protease YdiL (CAAX protease family)